MDKKDTCLVRNIDHVRFFVGNALQSASFYCQKFGFKHSAFSGLQTGNRTRCTHVVTQGSCTFAFTSSLSPEDHVFHDEMRKHGDTVQDIAFTVSNVDDAFAQAIQGGALCIESPHDEHYSEGDYVRKATIKMPIGNWVHTLIDRTHQTSDLFLPGYRHKCYQTKGSKTIDHNYQETLEHFDHAAFAIEKDSLHEVVEMYAKCFGFARFLSYDDDATHGLTISSEDTKSSGLTTMTIAPGETGFKFVLVEPVNRNNTKSQIQEFLDFHSGPGVAHIALNTSDIIQAVGSAIARGVDFINVPSTYYDTWRDNESRTELYASVQENWEQIQQHEILVDGGKVQNGYLLQTFTLPMGDRPTFYLEVICRRGGNNGFGKGNIKSLFDAIERLQKERGNYQS